jgi:hypothetical protein
MNRLATVGAAAAVLAPSAFGAGMAKHGFANPRAPKLLQAGLRANATRLHENHIQCLWEVKPRSVGCTLFVRSTPVSLLFEPYAKGRQKVTATNLNTYKVISLKHDRCPRELKCY